MKFSEIYFDEEGLELIQITDSDNNKIGILSPDDEGEWYYCITKNVRYEFSAVELVRIANKLNELNDD